MNADTWRASSGEMEVDPESFKSLRKQPVKMADIPVRYVLQNVDRCFFTR